MAQLSRPFQIALAAVVLVAGVALFAFKGGSSSNSTGGAGASVPANSSSAPASSPSRAASSKGGATAQAPGVAGLSRAVEKAHGAVATSQQNARQLEQKSNQASESGPATQHAGGTSAPGVAAAKPAPAAAVPTHSASTKSSASTRSSAKATRPKHGAPAKQRAVEKELAAGNIVVLLFWDHKGADDIAVRNVVVHLGGHRVVVHVSSAGQVAEYGTVTRGVQVLSTPTTVVVAPGGQAKVLTGLTDAFSLRQAISEARALKS